MRLEDLPETENIEDSRAGNRYLNQAFGWLGRRLAQVRHDVTHNPLTPSSWGDEDIKDVSQPGGHLSEDAGYNDIKYDPSKVRPAGVQPQTLMDTTGDGGQGAEEDLSQYGGDAAPLNLNQPKFSRAQTAIINAARAGGVDPSAELAIAERESDFDVRNRPLDNHGRPTSSAWGLFQLLKRERDKYGGHSDDPDEQAKAGISYLKDLQREMRGHVGRDPTGPELYAGHYWGGSRGARLATGQIAPQTPVSQIFSQAELVANPNIVRAGTAGNLTRSVFADISKRASKFGGLPEGDLTEYAEGGSTDNKQPSLGSGSKPSPASFASSMTASLINDTGNAIDKSTESAAKEAAQEPEEQAPAPLGLMRLPPPAPLRLMPLPPPLQQHASPPPPPSGTTSGVDPRTYGLA